MQHIKEKNLVGKCFRHRCPLTKNLVKEKDYRCVDCHNSFKYQKSFWEDNPDVQGYLRIKNKTLVKAVTPKGHAVYRLKSVK